MYENKESSSGGIGQTRGKGSRSQGNFDALETGPHQASQGSSEGEMGKVENARKGRSYILHGGCNLPEYESWRHMTSRCRWSGNAWFSCYGGRGISVCDRWLHSFPNFYLDMGPKPSPHHTIERVNNNGNYEPGNCRWATPSEQSLNTRRNRRLTFDGKTLTIMEWSKITGLHRNTLSERIKSGWPTELALTRDTHNGVSFKLFHTSAAGRMRAQSGKRDECGRWI